MKRVTSRHVYRRSSFQPSTNSVPRFVARCFSQENIVIAASLGQFVWKIQAAKNRDSRSVMYGILNLCRLLVIQKSIEIGYQI